MKPRTALLILVSLVASFVALGVERAQAAISIIQHHAKLTFPTSCEDQNGTWTIGDPVITTVDDGGQPYTIKVRPVTKTYPLSTTSVTVTWMVTWQDGAQDSGSQAVSPPSGCVSPATTTPTTQPPVATTEPPVVTTVPPATTTPTTAPATTVPPCRPGPGEPGFDACGDCSTPELCDSFKRQQRVGALPATGASPWMIVLIAVGCFMAAAALLLSVRRPKMVWPHRTLNADAPTGYHRIRSGRSGKPD